jgi:hypothetical protein
LHVIGKQFEDAFVDVELRERVAGIVSQGRNRSMHSRLRADQIRLWDSFVQLLTDLKHEGLIEDEDELGVSLAL